MTFVRTTDLAIVRRIMTEPSVYRNITDDGCPPASDFRPVDDPRLWYVLVYDGANVIGLFMFVPLNAATWEVHTCLLPVARGPLAHQAAWEVLDWLWSNAPCQRLITNVPAFNRLALRFAKEAGMQQFGFNPDSYLKGGKLHGQYLLGIDRPPVSREEVA